MSEYNLKCDLTGKLCRVVGEQVRQELIDCGITPSSTMLEIEYEDGSTMLTLPWDVSEILDDND